MAKAKALVLMGSDSDSETVEHCCLILRELGIPYDARVTSAHRTSERLHHAASNAERDGYGVIIGFAGGSAHLQGMASAAGPTIPVLGVAVLSSKTEINTLAAMLSQTQMPAGVPLAYMGMGEAGSKNAALFAAAILGRTDSGLQSRLALWRSNDSKRAAAMVPKFTKVPVSYEGE